MLADFATQPPFITVPEHISWTLVQQHVCLRFFFPLARASVLLMSTMAYSNLPPKFDGDGGAARDNLDAGDESGIVAADFELCAAGTFNSTSV